MKYSFNGIIPGMGQRLSILARLAIAALVTGVGGCCIPYGTEHWETAFSGKTENILGEGTGHYLEGLRIIRNGSHGQDALVFYPYAHNLTTVLIFCHVPAGDSGGNYVLSADSRNGEAEAWLLRGEDRFDWVNTGEPLFLLLPPGRRAEVPDAIPMNGAITLKGQGDRIDLLRVDLRVPTGRRPLNRNRPAC